MIVSRPRNAPENEPDALAASSTSDLNRVGARSAFVIDIGDSLRRSVIEHLKKEGWIVHGIKRAEQALPLLRNVPYQPRVQDAYELAAPFAAYGIRVRNRSRLGQMQLAWFAANPGDFIRFHPWCVTAGYR
jgi:hypothetical protein